MNTIALWATRIVLGYCIIGAATAAILFHDAFRDIKNPPTDPEALNSLRNIEKTLSNPLGVIASFFSISIAWPLFAPSIIRDLRSRFEQHRALRKAFRHIHRKVTDLAAKIRR